jgi:hypothetical protein
MDSKTNVMKIFHSLQPYICILIAVVFMTSVNAQIPNLRNKIFHGQLNEQVTLQERSSQNNFKRSQTKDAPPIRWQKCIGGSRDEYAQNSIIKLSDGNYLTCGSTNSHNGDFNAGHGKYDAFLMKTDAEGKILWEKTYGGSGNDAFNNMVETSNGEIYAIGNTTSNDGQVSGNHGGSVYGDIWLVKTNSNGKLLSQHCFGGSGDEWTQGLIMTQHGNIVFPAATNSTDGDVSNNHGDYDGWVVKLKLSGAIDFAVTIGDIADDEFYSIAEANGNFIVSGESSTKNAYDPEVEKYYDALVAKLDQSGNIIFYRKYGGSGSDNSNAVVASSDGNAVLTGHTSSNDGDVKDNYGFNIWVWKIDVAHNGNIIWQNFIGIPKDTAAGFNLTQTQDGGFVIIGAIAPNELAPFDTWDAYAAKVDRHGAILWTKQFGGSNFDVLFSITKENDRSILIAGATSSNDEDVSGNHGGAEDVWLVNLGKCNDRISASADDDITTKTTISGEQRKVMLNNYPNPFSNSTTISFFLNQSQKVSIQIFDETGKFVRTLTDAKMQAGTHQLVWNAKDEKGNAVNAGIYFLRMQAGDYTETKKLVVVR